MTNRERFLRWMRGEETDRMPLRYGGPRESTFVAWRKQGLREEQIAHWRDFVGEDPTVGIGKVDSDPIPRFEEVVLEERGNKKVWIDFMGAKRLDHRDPATPGFVTRSYLEFPVKRRDDFLEMKKRYDPSDPRRYLPNGARAPSPDPATWTYAPDDMRIYLNRHRICNEGHDPVVFVAIGPYWRARDWCGFEGLSVMFYEQPDLVREMFEFWTDFTLRLYAPVLEVLKADCVIISEDMAFKTQPMISPAMMREFLVPCYRRLIPFFKGHGVDFVVMDSDGHNSQILEVFIPEELDGIQPLEIAANNDPEAYFSRYPRMVGWGGIDKRELRFDKARVRAEVIRRVRTARRHRRFIPQVDHGVPPDIPIRNFLYMVELLQGLARGEDLDTHEPPGKLDRQLGTIEEMFDPLNAIPAGPDEDAEES